MDSSNNIPSVGNDNLEDLLKKNIELSQEILGLARYIKNYVFWQQIFSWIKFALIAIPIILGLIYLPPLVRDMLDSYAGLGALNLNGLESGLNIDKK